MVVKFYKHHCSVCDNEWETNRIKANKCLQCFTIKHEKEQEVENAKKDPNAILECPDSPYVVILTFDGGRGNTYRYKMCKICKEYPIFKRHVLRIEYLTKSAE